MRLRGTSWTAVGIGLALIVAAPAEVRSDEVRRIKGLVVVDADGEKVGDVLGIEASGQTSTGPVPFFALSVNGVPVLMAAVSTHLYVPASTITGVIFFENADCTGLAIAPGAGSNQSAFAADRTLANQQLYAVTGPVAEIVPLGFRWIDDPGLFNPGCKDPAENFSSPQNGPQVTKLVDLAPLFRPPFRVREKAQHE